MERQICGICGEPILPGNTRPLAPMSEYNYLHACGALLVLFGGVWYEPTWGQTDITRITLHPCAKEEEQ